MSFTRDNLNWHHSLHTPESWPREHWTNLRYKGLEKLGDIKACWEWNRHQHFVTLGLAYRATGDERYTRAFTHGLETWCAQNPPQLGIHYVSNLEIGLRCVSWLWADRLFADAEAYTDEPRALLYLNILYQAQRLARNLGYSERAARNNHLLGDASCLAVIAMMLPEVRESQSWARRALAALSRAITEQILPDGLHFERSLGYHLFVLELVLQVELLARRQAVQVPPFLETISRMADVVWATRQPDGSYPALNDCDDGAVWALHCSSSERTDLVLGLASVVCNRPELAPEADSWGQEWLLPAERGEPIGSKQPGCRSFDHGGVFVMRQPSVPSERGDFLLIANQGDPFPRSGHNHAALLHLILWIDGRPVLIDAGTYRYNDAGEFRNALRSTRAHNTIEIDGAGQAEPFRSFGWLSKSRPGCAALGCGDGHALFDGLHHSYERGPGPVRHRRTVLWLRDEGLWIIRDELTGSGSHELAQYWHLPGDLDLNGEGSDLTVSNSSGVVALIDLLMRPGDRLRTYCGEANLPWTWESPRYGELRKRHSLCRSWTGSLPTVRTVLVRKPASTTPVGGEGTSGAGTIRAGRWCLLPGQFPAAVSRR